jgi:DNA-binding MurR/RpiR family transcriptional regulator
VVIAGGHYSGLVGRVAQLQLAKVRPDVVFLEDPMGRDLPAVTDLRRHDVLLVLDVRRYQQHLLLAAEAAKRNSASVALITDQWLSPIAGIADVVLPAAVDVSFFDSQVGCLALVETIVHETATRIDGALDRLRALEDLRPAQKSN